MALQEIHKATFLENPTTPTQHDRQLRLEATGLSLGNQATQGLSVTFRLHDSKPSTYGP
jgi:hypothetical protein